MKFSKVLQRLASELPELDDMFLRYKALKKQLKTIPVQQEDGANGQLNHNNLVQQMCAEEEQFISTLNQDLAKFNQFFIDREEEAVIQLQVLQERMANQPTPDVLSSLVDFHGQCVLLLHWSLLNYAAVAKILKKHDKRTGVLLRAPYLASCLQQPFNSTAIMSRLVKRAEELLSTSLGSHSSNGQEAQGGISGEGTTMVTGDIRPSVVDGTSIAHHATNNTPNSDDEGSCLTAVPDSALFRRTRLALETWDTLSRTAATPSTVLMEPCTGAHSALPQLARPTTPGAPAIIIPSRMPTGTARTLSHGLPHILSIDPPATTQHTGLSSALTTLTVLGASIATMSPMPHDPALAPGQGENMPSLLAVRMVPDMVDMADAAQAAPSSPHAGDSALAALVVQPLEAVTLHRESDRSSALESTPTDDPFRRDSKRSFATLGEEDEEGEDSGEDREGGEIQLGTPGSAGGAKSSGQGSSARPAHRLRLQFP